MAETDEKIRVLFVCMGNICRSPTAEGLFVHLLEREGLRDRIEVDSAGTHSYHIGNPPDARAAAAALRRGICIDALRARGVSEPDFDRFDYILAMDRDNYLHLEAMCPPAQRQKLKLLLEYAPHLGEREVPDPYYGGAGGFERVMDLLEHAVAGLLDEIRTRHRITAETERG